MTQIKSYLSRSYSIIFLYFFDLMICHSFHVVLFLTLFISFNFLQFAQTTAGKLVAASKASGKQLEALKAHT